MRAARSSVPITAVIVFSALLAVGCGNGNTLEGSAGNSVSLDFDFTIIALQTVADQSWYIIEYKRDNDAEAAEVTHDNVVCPVEENVEMVFASCAILDRTVIDGTEFDDVAGGRIIFYELGAVGQIVRGEFDVLFQNGLTLSGEFRGELEERG